MSDETILVVDDNRQIANFIANKLLPGLGYETLVAYDGKTALHLVKTRRLSLILLDLQLPDMNGLDLLRKMSAEGINIPTILATAYGSEKVAVDAFRLGVQDYLIKPVDPDTLNAAITRSLGESRLRKEKANLTARLKEQISWLAELLKVGQSVTSTLEVDEVLRRIVEAGVKLTRADEGFLALLDEKNGQLFLRAVKNLDQEESKTLRLPINDPLVGSVLRNKRPLRLNCKDGDELIKVSTGFLVNNLLHAPILLREKPIGVLSVDNRGAQRPFKEIDEAMLTSLADYASVAIDNANLYQKSQLEIQERAKVEHALRESEMRYALAVRGSNEGLWDWDLKTNKIYFSPRWITMLGYTDGEITNDPQEWFNRVHADDIEQIKIDILAHIRGVTSHFENEHRMKHKNGSYRWMLTRGLAVWDTNGTANRMAGSMSDIQERKSVEQQLHYDAMHDALTDLPNRALFMDRLKYSVARAKRVPSYRFAVLFLDLDRFKDINDSLGHMLGDQVLVEAAKLLSRHLRSTDTIARFGGDEFVILLDDITAMDDATRIADRVQNELMTSLRLHGRKMYITTSIGIVLSATGYDRPEDVLRDADIAMYRAKALGKARYEIFDATMRDRIIDRLGLEADLRQAIGRNELRLHYQPIVDLNTGKLVGFESLLRWKNSRRGALSPADFIPLAEETGLIIPIDRWVMRHACEQMQRWQEEFPEFESLRISVNITAKQVAQPDFVDYVQKTLNEVGIKPSSLTIEVTESVIMDNIEMAAAVFKQLQKLGVWIEIDDFGVGYSSLSYLAHLSINALKVDQSFISMMVKKDSHLKIVQSIVMMAHGLGLSVIAEGLETLEQLELVRNLGCENGQGYYLSRPMPEADAYRLLQGITEGQSFLKINSCETAEEK
jgi:diguanylate cyclase (GGDEF)-like protein/PAS domain S-box-containing protein